MNKDVYMQRYSGDRPRMTNGKDVILVPPYRATLRPSKKSFPKKNIVCGFDTETYRGEPLSFQFSIGEKSEIIFCDKKNIMQKFTAYLKKIPLSSGVKTAFVFAHNLEFDLEIALFPVLTRFLSSEFEHWDKKNRALWSVKCDKLCFADLCFYRYKKVLRRFRFIDTGAFFRKGERGFMTLKEVARLLGVGEKGVKPNGLGGIKYTSKDAYFVEYAKNDALLAERIGKKLMENFQKFDIPPCVSISQEAQRVFQKKFLKDVVSIPPENVLKASILAFHGGKNGFYLDRPQEIEDVSELDVNSMYPFQATNLFPWTTGVYRKVYGLDYEHPGVYRVSGFAMPCRYRTLFNHGFKPLEGEFKNIWIHSSEIMEALSKGELKIESIEGYVFIPDSRASNPMREFVNYFYDLKSKTQGGERELNKLILNAGCYGKYVQNINIQGRRNLKVRTKEIEGVMRVRSIVSMPALFKAGGMFHPFIACAITAQARVMLHNLEHKYGALDSSTDSIKTTMPVNAADLGKEMGKLSLKHQGRCIFLRSKLYAFVDAEGRPEKAALHGFGGTAEQLLKIYRTHDTRYSFPRMTKLKESFIQNKTPFVMEQAHRELNIAWEPGLFGSADLHRAEERGVLKGDLPVDRNLEDAADSLDNKSYVDSFLTKKEQKTELRRHTHPTLKEFFGSEGIQ